MRKREVIFGVHKKEGMKSSNKNRAQKIRVKKNLKPKSPKNKETKEPSARTSDNRNSCFKRAMIDHYEDWLENLERDRTLGDDNDTYNGKKVQHRNAKPKLDLGKIIMSEAISSNARDGIERKLSYYPRREDSPEVRNHYIGRIIEFYRRIDQYKKNDPQYDLSPDQAAKTLEYLIVYRRKMTSGNVKKILTKEYTLEDGTSVFWQESETRRKRVSKYRMRYLKLRSDKTRTQKPSSIYESYIARGRNSSKSYAVA